MKLKHHRSDYVSQFTYDKFNRVTRGDYKGGSSPFDNQYETFNMDDLGNRYDQGSVYGAVLRDGTNKSYSVDNATNQYTVANSVMLTNAYDNAGNMIKDELGYRYYYDYENRITEIRRSDNTTVVAQFAYDALGRRIKKVDSIAGTTTLYYYNTNWQVLVEKNADLKSLGNGIWDWGSV